MLLLVVLVILSVLALIAASFSYRMEAERIGIEGLRDLQQARLAAESGMTRVLLLLRDDRTNMDLWWLNPDAFRRVPVFLPTDDRRTGIGGTESLVHKEAVDGQPAWRYSVVAYDQLNEDKVTIRYGLTDEAGKLNINFASRGELLRLVRTLDLGDRQPEELVDTLIDWRDADSDLMSPFGAETPWYMTLNPSYRAKNRPFESIDELLMVKNWNGRYLYGEDYNRNGYLDENEDDGPDGAFPPDNGDGKLERGLARLMTVYSWDWNFANDNKPREDINGLNWAEPDKLPLHLQEELTTELIEFLAEAKQRGFKFRSVGELWGLQVYEDGSSNYDEAWEVHRELVKTENALPKDESAEGEDDDGADDERDGEGGRDRDDEGEDPDDEGDGAGGGRNNGRPGEEMDEDEDLRDVKDSRLNQQVRDDQQGGRAPQGGRRGGRADQNNAPPAADANQGTPGPGAGRDGAGRGQRGGDGRANPGDNRGGGQGGRGGDQDGAGSQPGDDEESEEDEAARKGTPVASPVTAEQMHVVMDRLTTVRAATRVGQINVNTAPVEVLGSLIGMTQEEAQAIVARRRTMAGADKMTPAWLVSSGTLSPEQFAVLSNKFTARSIQFTADVIGFADHVGTFRRIQAVIEMRGHMAQIRYYRDISSLGIGFPVKDDERSQGFAFGNE